MHKDTLNLIMAVFILSIVVVTLILWTIEKVWHHHRVTSAILKSFGIQTENPDEDDADDDPFDVGMNDKDIL